jgi:hypothetical protein
MGKEKDCERDGQKERNIEKKKQKRDTETEIRQIYNQTEEQGNEKER